MDKIQLLQFLKERLAKHLSIDEADIKDKDKFASLGLNSAKATLLAIELAQKLKKKVSPTVFYAYPTPQELMGYLMGENAQSKKNTSALKQNQGQAIAIVGMSCRFPQAPNLRAFWSLLEGGKNAITEIPKDRWNIDDYYDEDSSLEGKIQTKFGGFVDNLDEFDPYFFDISPREASEMSPNQKMCMELAWEAFSHAKIRVTDLSGTKTGVFIGNVWNDFANLRIKKYAPINQHSAVGQSANIIANRISYAFGFQGPSLVIDSACSSSLYAVHLACQAIQNGDCEVALAGGVNTMLDPDTYVYMSKFGGLSITGQCHTFSAEADGYVRGEGAGMIVLKPLAKAIKDGDRVFAVVRGSAVNNDGASNSLTAPNLSAQKDVLRVAYQRAGIKPSAVHYIEAHGTGTKLGDPIEAEALSSVLGEGRQDNEPLLLGSAKTNIGHLEGAAGIAGVIKAVLAIQKQRIPKNLNFNTPNPYIPFEEWKLKVVSEAMEWKVDIGETRKAGVSAFGWGGTNAHVVLEEYVDAKPEILVVSGDNEDKLFKMLRGVHKIFQKVEEGKVTPEQIPSLKSICAVYANYPTHGSHRVALKAENMAELQKKLLDAMTGEERAKYAIVNREQKNKVAYIVSPFGGQYVGMGISLLENNQYFRAKFKQCDYHFKKISGWSLVDKLYEYSEEELDKIHIGIPLIFAIQVSLAELQSACGVEPDVVMGYSAGEYAAAHIAGLLTLEDAAKVAYVCGEWEKKHLEGTKKYGMAVVNRSKELLEQNIKEFDSSVQIVAINSEDSCNIGGLKNEVDDFIKILKNQGVTIYPMSINVSPHTSHVEDVIDDIEELLKTIKPIVPKIPMYSTALGRYITWEDMNGNYWKNNVRNTVQFSKGIYQLLDDGCDNFIELSPHPTLKYYLNQAVSFKGKKAIIHYALEKGKEETTTFQNLLMLLYLQGFNIKWNKLYSKYLIATPQTVLGDNSIEYNDTLPLPIAAKNEQAVREYAQNYLDFLQNNLDNSQKDLYDLCAMTALKKTPFDYRVCFTGKNNQELIEKISDFVGNPEAPIYGNLAKHKKMAFVFSGQGSQWLGMGKSLMEEFDVFRENMEECNRAFSKYVSDWSLIDQINGNSPQNLLEDNDIAYIQPAIFAIQVSLAKLWISWGVIPDAVVGHSMGEVAAAYTANALKLDDAAKIICRRSALMKTLRGKGTMMVVELSYEKATELCKQYDNLDVAVNNSANSCIVGGLNESIEAFEKYLTEQQIFCRKVKVDVASHTAQMQPIVPTLAEEFADIVPINPDMVIYSSVEGSKIEGGQMTGQYWIRNLRQQVRFAKTIEAMITDEHGIFLEVSPHPVLIMPIRESLKLAGKENESLAVGSLLRDKPEEESLMVHLAELYSAGINIRWNKLYRSADTFVELPKYPWNREHFTIQDRSEEFAAASLKRNDGSAGHPFLEQYIELANQDEVDIWETRLNAENIPFLNAYKANGIYQFPIAAYLEMLEAATDELYSKADYASHSLYVEKPIILSEESNPIIQLKIRSTNEKQSDFEIFVANLKDKAFKKRQWDLVASGNIKIAEKIENFPNQPVKSWVKGHKESLLKKDYYTFLQTLGLDYDADYQCVEKVWSLGNRVIAQVVPTEKIKKEQSKYKLHPLIIGGCIRTMFFIMPVEMLANAQNYEYYVSSIQDMYISNQSEYQSPFWAECELLPYDSSKVVQEGVEGNFTLYDNDGKVIAKSQNFKLQQKLREAQDAHQYFYDVVWQKQEVTLSPNKKAGKQSYLLYRHQDKVGKLMEQELRHAGHEVVSVIPHYAFKDMLKQQRIEINPLQKEDYNKVWQVLQEQNIQPDHIIYAWGTEKDADEYWEVEELENTALLYNMGLVYAVQALTQIRFKVQPHLSVVTVGTQAIENSRISMVGSMLWGIAKVIRNEHSEFVCQTIDVSPTLPEIEIKALLNRLIKAQKEEEVVLRQNYQYVPRLQNYTLGKLKKGYNAIRIERHKTYLITGGLGGLGLAFAQWLVQRGATHLALMGRSKPSSQALETVGTIEKMGAVVKLVQGDVSDEISLGNALQQIRSDMPPIAGVFHTAGILDDSSLMNMQNEQFMRVMAPKVQGAWNLHKLTQDEPITSFVLFSSAASILGLTGQSNYVAANTFLDSLAAYRREQNLPALSVNWGAVSDVGLAAAQGNRGERLEGEGIRSMDTQKYLQLFDRIFVEEIGQVGILEYYFHEWKKVYPAYASASFFEFLDTTPIANKAQVVVSKTKVDEWKAINDSQKQIQWLEGILREKTANITKATATKVSLTTSFKNLGVDSLMLVQLRNALDEVFALKLSVSSFFSHPTIKEYAKYLLEQLLEAHPSQKEKEAVSAPNTSEAEARNLPPVAIPDYGQMSLDELSKALDAELNF